MSSRPAFHRPWNSRRTSSRKSAGPSSPRPAAKARTSGGFPSAQAASYSSRACNRVSSDDSSCRAGIVTSSVGEVGSVFQKEQEVLLALGDLGPDALEAHADAVGAVFRLLGRGRRGL